MSFRRSFSRFNASNLRPPRAVPQAHEPLSCPYAHLHNHNVHGQIQHYANFDECDYTNGYAPYQTPFIGAEPAPQGTAYLPQFEAYSQAAYPQQSLCYRPPPNYDDYSNGRSIRPPLPPQQELAPRATAVGLQQRPPCTLHSATSTNALNQQSELLNEIKNEMMKMKKEMACIKNATQRMCEEADLDDDEENSMKMERNRFERSSPSKVQLKTKVDEDEVLWLCIKNQSCCKRDISRTLQAEPDAVYKALRSLKERRYISKRGKGFILKNKYLKENLETNLDEYLRSLCTKYGPFFAAVSSETNSSASSEQQLSGQKRNREKESDDGEQPPFKKQRQESLPNHDAYQKQTGLVLSVSEMQQNAVIDSNHNKNMNAAEPEHAEHSESNENVQKYRRRRRYSPWEKIQVLREYHVLLVRNYNANSKAKVTALQQEVADRFDIDRTLVYRWYQQKGALWTYAQQHSKYKKKNERWNKSALQRRRNIGKVQACKYHEQEKQLHEIFVVRRKKGRKINKLWFKLKFKQLLLRDKPIGYETFAYSDGWFSRFKKRWNVVKRKRTNKKTEDLLQREPLLKKFHVLLHSIRNDDRFEHQSPEYGRFSAENTYVFDEIPMPFIFDEETTYETKGSDRVYVKACGAGLDKRQYTVGMTLRATGEQHVEPIIIFRGKGDKNKCYDLKHNLHPNGVCVLFQEKAWMNTKLMIEYLRHYKRCRMNWRCFDKSWLIMDNEKSHKTDSAKGYGGAAVGANALLTYTPPNCTDSVSVVDRVTHLFKKYVCYEYEKWVDANFDEWEHQRTSAYERRVLFSHWVLTAWNKLRVQRDLLTQMFIECGILLKRDGSDANKIHIPGLHEYSFI